MFTVYALEDQRFAGLQSVFYIGITEDVYARFFQHLRCDDGNIDKGERIEEIKTSSVMLIMRTIETVETFEEASDREQHWIHHYLSQGIRLCNVDIACSFTYEDFLVKMGKISSEEANKYPKRFHSTAKCGLAPSVITFTRRKPMTVSEVAQVLGRSERQVRGLRAQGKLLKDETDEKLIQAASVRAYLKKKVKVS